MQSDPVETAKKAAQAAAVEATDHTKTPEEHAAAVEKFEAAKEAWREAERIAKAKENKADPSN